jgi:carbon-monoxide dehydrogenase large subunit
MPRADNMPPIVSSIRPVPTKLQSAGCKGRERTGNVGAPAAIINAIVDALSSYKVTDCHCRQRLSGFWHLIRRPENRSEGPLTDSGCNPSAYLPALELLIHSH